MKQAPPPFLVFRDWKGKGLDPRRLASSVLFRIGIQQTFIETSIRSLLLNTSDVLAITDITFRIALAPIRGNHRCDDLHSKLFSCQTGVIAAEVEARIERQVHVTYFSSIIKPPYCTCNDEMSKITTPLSASCQMNVFLIHVCL